MSERGERKKAKEESSTSFYPKATARCLYSLSLGGREASLLHCKLVQKPRPKPIEETPFICPSELPASFDVVPCAVSRGLHLFNINGSWWEAPWHLIETLIIQEAYLVVGTSTNVLVCIQISS